MAETRELRLDPELVPLAFDLMHSLDLESMAGSYLEPIREFLVFEMKKAVEQISETHPGFEFDQTVRGIMLSMLAGGLMAGVLYQDVVELKEQLGQLRLEKLGDADD